jgi:hypothetical protein
MMISNQQKSIAHQRESLKGWLSSSLSTLAAHCALAWPQRKVVQTRLEAALAEGQLQSLYISLRLLAVLVFLYLVQFSQLAAATALVKQPCSPSRLDALLEFAQHSGVGDVTSAGVIAHACKVWPKDENITLAAMVYEGKRGRALLVAMWNNEKTEGIAVLSGKLPLEEGCTLDRPVLAIDTARFDVMPGVRAFGIDMADEQGVICKHTGLVRLRSLFVLEQQELKPILDGFNLIVERSRVSRTSATASSVTTADIRQITLKISFQKSRSNGYVDMEVFSVSNPAGDQIEPFRAELKFDGYFYSQRQLQREYIEWLDKYYPSVQ